MNLLLMFVAGWLARAAIHRFADEGRDRALPPALAALGLLAVVIAGAV